MVLQAGMYAPTAKNGQSPIIIAVQNPEEVAAVNALNAKFTPHTAPYYLSRIHIWRGGLTRTLCTIAIFPPRRGGSKTPGH